MTLLRAVSLWQPHAGLMAVGAKGVESRPRTFSHRGPLAIQATAGIPAKHRETPEKLMYREPLKSVLNRNGWWRLDDMPRGVIVALVWVDTETRITSQLMRAAIAAAYGPEELHFGWYEDGRVAIHTDRAKLIRIPEPVKCSGMQGLWNVPPEALAAIVAQVKDHANFHHYRDAFGAFAGAEERGKWKCAPARPPAPQDDTPRDDRTAPIDDSDTAVRQ